MRTATATSRTASHRGQAPRTRHCSSRSRTQRHSSCSWWPSPVWPHAHHAATRVPAASSLQPLSAWDAPATAPVRPREPSEALEYDVLGVGQAAVDVCVSVPDDMLVQLDVAKGGRRLISVAERASVMQSLEGLDTQVSAGGSLANTLVGLAQLASAQERAAARRQQQQQQQQQQPSGAATDPHQQPHSHRSQQQQQQRQPMRVALTGPVTGADALGEFAAAQLRAAGVEVVGPKPTGGATGTVMVLSTEDAQRSFLSCFSNEDSISLDAELAQSVARARLLVIEGYLWEVSGAATAIPALVRQARAAGTLVALTAGDAGVVQRHAGSILAAIAAGVDVLFSNEAEAAALTAALKAQQQQQQEKQQQEEQEPEEEVYLEDAEQDFTAEQLLQLCSSSPSSLSSSSSSSSQPSAGAGSSSPAQEAALRLASVCPMVAVTDGSRGAFITAEGQLYVVPPFWRTEPPVDTCGAGDAWAAGFLHGLITGLDLHSMGHVAAKTASAVISRHGPQLLPDDADWVLQGLTRPAAGLAGLAAGASPLAGARAAAVVDEAAAGSSPSSLTGRSGPGDR